MCVSAYQRTGREWRPCRSVIVILMGLARKDLAEGQTCGSKERLVFYLKGNWATASQEGSHPTGQPNVSCENISDSGAGSGVSEEQLCRRGRHPETSSIWVLPPLSAEPAGSGSHSWTPWWTRLMMTAATEIYPFMWSNEQTHPSYHPGHDATRPLIFWLDELIVLAPFTKHFMCLSSAARAAECRATEGLQ